MESGRHHAADDAQGRADMRKKQETYDKYRVALRELTFNSKPIINKLTLLAEELAAFCPVVARAISDHWLSVDYSLKLPVLYLIDSISKNLPADYGYVPSFCQYLPYGFSEGYFSSDPATRTKFLKVLQTWHTIYPSIVISDIEAAISPPQPTPMPPGRQHGDIYHMLPHARREYGAPYPNVHNVHAQHLANANRQSHHGLDFDHPDASLAHFPKRPSPEHNGHFGGPVPNNNAMHILSELQNFLREGTGDEDESRATNQASERMNKLSRSIRSLPKIEANYNDLMRGFPNDFYFIYDFYPLRCTACGLRYEDSLSGRSTLDFHMDCHFKHARRLKDRAKKSLSRDWFLSEKQWVHNFNDSNAILAEKETTDSFLDTASNVATTPVVQESTVVVTDGKSGICALCGDAFEKSWSPAIDDFVWKDATYDKSKRLVHTACQD